MKLKRSGFILVPLMAFFTAMIFAGEKRPWTIQEVEDQASYKEKVLIFGEIIDEPAFDYFLVDDGTARIIVDARDLPKNFRKGDSFFLQGRYVGASSKKEDLKEIEAYRAAKPDEEKKSRQLIARFGLDPAEQLKETAEEKPGASSPSSSVTQRLKELEGLKTEGLVSDGEYQKLREKILEDL